MIPDACGVRSPMPSTATAKVVGNMIELNSPTLKIVTAAT
jgi:hypothetical protein